MAQQFQENGASWKRTDVGEASEKDMKQKSRREASLRVLIIEDVPADAELVLREMSKLGIDTTHTVVDTRETFLKALDEFDPDIVLSDYSMPGFDGMAALKLLQKNRHDIPFIIITGSQNEEVAVDCMKAGAADYMIKENMRRLGPAVMAALEKYRLKREKERAEEEVRRNRDELEELVKERTVELQERNRKLGEEILERRKAEEEKKKVEAQLFQAQKIEALGRFAGGIAHDLNNILYPIIINTEILLEESVPGTGMHEMLDQTLKAAQRQKDLIKQILSFSRQSNQGFRQIKVGPLLKDTLGFLRSSLPSTIEMRQQIEATSDTIMGDPAQVRQVIVNLCRNAADSMESQRGVIEVVLSNMRLEPGQARHDLKEGEYLSLRIRDTGSGISSEALDRIFDPFYTTKGIGKGSGMGLSVVHGILKNHGGAIAVESEAGKGSVFTVYLPVCREEYTADSRKPLPDGAKKQKILLVDDEEIILTSLQRTLERSGYAVTTVKDGSEALELFERAPQAFDLVITDLTMPGITGIVLTKRLMEIRPDVRIILCTGFSDVISEHEARSLGIRELLLKPTGTGELKTAVRNALEY